MNRLILCARVAHLNPSIVSGVCTNGVFVLDGACQLYGIFYLKRWFQPRWFNQLHGCASVKRISGWVSCCICRAHAAFALPSGYPEDDLFSALNYEWPAFSLFYQGFL
jgi:hypothetical protein